MKISREQRIINETVLIQEQVIFGWKERVKALEDRLTAQDTRIKQLTNMVKGQRYVSKD